MSELCQIGPVSITNAQLYDRDAFSVKRSVGKTQASNTIIFQKGAYEQIESFTLITELDKALQLKGLVEIGEPVWVDTSSDITDNDYFQHKGWYLLTSIDFKYENLNLVTCDIDVELISTNPNEYLTMDYSRGIYDGIALDYTYTPTDTNTVFSDDFSTYDTNKWSAIQKGWWYGVQGTPTASVASDGSELMITTHGYANQDYSTAWVRSLQKFYPPFTVETVLDRKTLPATGDASISLGLSKEVMQEGSQGLWKNGAIEWWYAQWMLGPSATQLELAFSNQGNWSQQYPWTSQGTTNEELKVRVSMDANANIVVVIANGTGGVFGTEREIYRGPSGFSNPSWGFYLYPLVHHKDPIDYTGSFHYMNVTQDTTASVPYVVTLPYATTGSPSATGNRTGEDGNIPYYTSPTTEIRFAKPTDLYKGGVKLTSSNNDDSAVRNVYATDYRLTPTTTILKNEFTKLIFGATGFEIQGYYGGQWNSINTITTGTINIIKPLLINHDKVVLQVNDMKIEMLRSNPMITVKHPNTTLGFIARDRFYNNGALNIVGAGDAIAMTNLTDGYYAYAYDDASDTYRLIIGKKDPTSIVNNSITAADYTGLGWYEKTQTGVNLPDSLVKQWWRQTHTGVSFKQIV